MAKNINKIEIHRTLIAYVTRKIEQMERELEAVRDSAIAETKSSMGDKYETSREMMMQEQNRLGKQYDLLKDQLATLESMDAEKTYSEVKHGALVKTDKSIFFISSAIGQIEVNGEKVFAISGNAPISQEMEGMKTGDSFSFNGISHSIKYLE